MKEETEADGGGGRERVEEVLDVERDVDKGKGVK